MLNQFWTLDKVVGVFIQVGFLELVAYLFFKVSVVVQGVDDLLLDSIFHTDLLELDLSLFLKLVISIVIEEALSKPVFSEEKTLENIEGQKDNMSHSRHRIFIFVIQILQEGDVFLCLGGDITRQAQCEMNRDFDNKVKKLGGFLIFIVFRVQYSLQLKLNTILDILGFFLGKFYLVEDMRD